MRGSVISMNHSAPHFLCDKPGKRLLCSHEQFASQSLIDAIDTLWKMAENRKERSNQQRKKYMERNHFLNSRRKKGGIRFSVRTKILMLAAIVVLPFLFVIFYLLASMSNYSQVYERIVSDITVANNYNLNFKEEMDESMYKLVVGYVTFDNISEEDTLKNPYDLIDELRSEFTDLMDVTAEGESRVWLQSLLNNLDTLEARVDDIVETTSIDGQYDDNIERLDNNIYVLTELIQDDIQYYIYYQTQNMEEVTSNLNTQIRDFIIFFVGIMAVLIFVITIAAVLIASGIIKPVRELYGATQKIARGDFSARAKINTTDEIAELENISEDCVCSMVSAPSETVINFPSPADSDILTMTMVSPVFTVPDRKMELVMEYYRLLQTVNADRDNVFRREIMKSVFYSMMLEVCDAYRQYGTVVGKSAILRHEQLGDDLFRLLSRHCRTHRSVSFYAEKLNITPKYLSREIKRITGRTVQEWINRLTIMEMKKQLNIPGRTVMQISEDMDFSSPSAFVQFFKLHTGTTPLKYRRSAR